ncbi:MAG: tetratricopeptide repeat protein [Oligoflexales bacterium]|nr:tetratricopeptide repeat protein [Oligoflexales bacterium]
MNEDPSKNARSIYVPLALAILFILILAIALREPLLKKQEAEAAEDLLSQNENLSPPEGEESSIETSPNPVHTKSSEKVAPTHEGELSSSAEAQASTPSTEVPTETTEGKSSPSDDKFQDLMIQVMKLVDENKPQDAQKILEDILKENPNYELALTELGMIHLLDYKDPQAAAGFFEKAIKSNAENNAILSELVEIYGETGQAEKGLQFLQERYEEHPENNNLALGIGQLYLRQEKAQEAIPYLEKSAEDGRDDGSIQSLAQAYSAAGQSSKAIETYRKIMESEKEKINAGRYGEYPDEGQTRMASAQLGLLGEVSRQNNDANIEAEIEKMKQTFADDKQSQILQQLLYQGAPSPPTPTKNISPP